MTLSGDEVHMRFSAAKVIVLACLKPSGAILINWPPPARLMLWGETFAMVSMCQATDAEAARGVKRIAVYQHERAEHGGETGNRSGD